MVSNRADIIEQMANEREAFYQSLSNFDTFRKGWLRRNDETRKQALAISQFCPSTLIFANLRKVNLK